MLSDIEILDYGLVKDLNEDNLQPHSLDCVLGNDIRVAHYNEETQERIWKEETCRWGYKLLPYQFALATTVEYVQLPYSIVGFVQGKSTVGRNGLQIECAGLIDSGFEGNITLELFNMAPWPIILKEGMRICQLHFTRVNEPELKDYREIGSYHLQKGVTLPKYEI